MLINERVGAEGFKTSYKIQFNTQCAPKIIR